MMMNLFSIFEPTSIFKLNLNWLGICFPLLILFFNYWIMPSRIMMIKNFFLNFINNDMSNNFKKKNLMMIMILMSLMSLILMWNFLGLFSYIFTPSSHLSVTLCISLLFWISLMIFGWMNNTNSMFEHLIPLGTPLMLSVFMVLIESISSLIRPITLSVRLAANMVAGHLLISLLSNIPEMKSNYFVFILPMLICLYVLEISVAFIQSYVFVTLLSLYINEMN